MFSELRNFDKFELGGNLKQKYAKPYLNGLQTYD